jgi:hypothetical protein
MIEIGKIAAAAENFPPGHLKIIAHKKKSLQKSLQILFPIVLP